MFHQQYVLLLAAMLGTQELAVLTALQRRFLAEGLNFLPAHSMSECVESMLSIAKVRLS